MRKVMLYFVVLLLVSVSILADNFQWFTGKADLLLQKGKLPDWEENDILLYRDNKPAGELKEYLTMDYIWIDTKYAFKDNQLIGIEQVFTPFTSKGEPTLFEELAEYLSSKYGEETEAREIWTNKEKAGDRFLLVYAGELKLLRIWMTEDMNIYLFQQRLENQIGPHVFTAIYYLPITPP
jgi:hypothetical protein